MRPQNGTDADLAIVIISTNEAHWLTPCLSTVFARAGDARLDVVVVDNLSTDGTRELVEQRFPQARVVTCPNRGFAHANNRGAETTSARYVLFLNPDTEIVDGTFGALVDALDARPQVGLVGVRQITGDGDLYPTVRWFPSAVRALADAVSAERWPVRPAWLKGERQVDVARYDEELECDWTSGSFLLCRREALLSAGLMDERFFIYSEEPDLCLRMKRAGWGVRHLPAMTIVHHAGKGGTRPKMIAQDTYARRQYAEKHFAAPHRALYLGAIGARYVLRAAPIGSGDEARARREAARRALRILAGREAPPFGTPPATAIDRSAAAARPMAPV
jgi:N-acetylglucosaminyl-diphospho-decaprenol L-rhamnosyltransferase